MTRSPGNFLSFTTVLALALGPLHAHADDTEGLSLYGSLRTQVESVAPDRSGSFHRYEALRDAYSRFGIQAAHSVNEQLTLFGQVEVPLDTANLRVRDPYDQGGAGRSNGERFRLALLGARTPLGTLTYGQQWMPYYNAIAAPVDMFSSYYSGFATYTVFRVRQTLAYVSPELHGLSFAFAHADANGNRRSTSRIDDKRIQASATYVFNDTRIALGMADRGDAGYGRNRLYGLAISQRLGALYLAAKYETFDTGTKAAGSFARDGNEAINLFASYTIGKNTIKAMLAKVHNYGEKIIHLGVDHQYSDRLKFFAEYYHEQETAAITDERGGLADFDGSIRGGRAFLTGLRYDF